MKVELKLGVTYSENNIVVDFEDYEMDKSTWEGMSKEDQEDWLYENVIDQFDQPSWAIDSIEEQ